MDLRELAGRDLNLLPVFSAVFEELHVTRAAAKLGLSQPALSHALKRLRQSFNDELFVKTPKGMLPTEKARTLAPLVKEILERIDQRVFKDTHWDLLSARRTFKIQSTDYVESLLLPTLLPLLQNQARATSLSFTTARFSLPREELESGKTDLAIAGFFGELPGGFYRQKIFSDHFRAAVRTSHPRLGRKSRLTVEDLVREEHLMIAPGGELTGQLDRVLEKNGAVRRTVAGLSTFMASGAILAQTDCLLVGPSKMFESFAKPLGLKIFLLPVELPPIQIVQVWHEQNHRDPHHQWMREQVKNILAKG